MKYARVLLGCLPMLAYACGGGTAASTATPVDVADVQTPVIDAYDYMSANTAAVFTVDVTQARNSPYYQLLRETAEGPIRTMAQNEPNGEAKVNAVLSLIESLQRVYLPIGPDPERPDRSEPELIVVEGTWTLQQYIDLARTLEPNDAYTPATVGAYPAVRFNERVILVELGQGRMLFGPTERVTPAAMEPPSTGFETQGLFAAMGGELLDGAIVSAVMDAGRSPDIAEEFMREFSLSGAGALRAGAFSLTGADGIRLRSVGEFSSPEAASGVASRILAMRDELLAQPQFAMLGLSSVMNSLTAEAAGTRTTATMAATDAEVRALVATAIGLFGMISAQSGAPAPQTAPGGPMVPGPHPTSTP
ncbi:MAG: hypothetical protein AAF411_26865 [Myxococcota bacterium]